jgi:phenylalanine-4-hydroxylase
MNIKPIGSNMTELQVNGHRILFSYETPVAAWDNDSRDWVRTDKFWSVTTSRHINKWLDGVEALEVPQNEIDELVA